MDKGCSTCKHDGVGFVQICADCTASGTFKRWVPKFDPVNHPTHYTSGCGFECIEMMEMVFGKDAVIDFCILNAFKYIWRHKKKNGDEDIAKAEWYLNHAGSLSVSNGCHNNRALTKMIEHIENLKGERE